MPSKRRFIIFLIVLSAMLLIKYLHGQESPGEAAIGWDPVNITREPTMGDYSMVAVILGSFAGMISGLVKVRKRNRAAREGRCFDSDLVCLNLGE